MGKTDNVREEAENICTKLKHKEKKEWEKRKGGRKEGGKKGRREEGKEVGRVTYM